MGKRRVQTRGRHRAQKSRSRGLRGATAAASAVGVAGVAVAGAALIGMAPTMSASPQLLSTLHYLRGTNIGAEPTEQQFQDFIAVVLDGTGTTPPDGPYEKVPYNAGFRPFSHGGFKDLTYDDSVAQGLDLLEGQHPAQGDIIFGFSQGAVVASQYKATHTGNTYVLVENPSRPNGGIMERFKGLHIPFLDVTFSGATPNNGDYTVDVARQYDGWADFPTYLWNPLAVANAVAGIVLIHGKTQTELTAADLEAAEASGNSDYYQYDAGSNTAYYVVKTYPIPLLMPLDPFLPDPVIAALDAPLRQFIETAYDRSDYSKPTRATFFPHPTPSQTTDQVDGPAVTTLSAAERPTSQPAPDESGQSEVRKKKPLWHPHKRDRQEVVADDGSDRSSSDAAQQEDTSKKSDDAKRDAKHDDAPSVVKRSQAGSGQRGAAGASDSDSGAAA